MALLGGGILHHVGDAELSQLCVVFVVICFFLFFESLV